MQSLFAGIHNAAANTTRRYQSAEFRETVQIAVPDDARSLPVHSVLVHGTKNVAGQYVHWRLYFQLGIGESIEFNSQRRSNDGITTLYIEHRGYTKSTKQPSIGDFEINFSKTLRVQEIVDFILGKGRDRYKLNEGGSGCRYWCKTVIRDLEDHHLVRGGSSDELERYMVHLNRVHGNQWVPYPLYQGTFY